MQNTWGRYSELEKGLISVLLVLVPFIVLMIAIYAYFLIVPPTVKIKKINNTVDYIPTNFSINATEEIEDEVTFEPELTEESNTEEESTEGSNIEEESTEGSNTEEESTEGSNTEEESTEGSNTEEQSMAKIKRSLALNPNQFIASIIESIYTDEPDSYYLKCPAVLLNNNYIITAYDCLKTNLTFIKVRSLSNFWSKDGIISSIFEVTHFDDLYSLGKLTKPIRNYYADVSIMFSPSETLKNIKFIDVYQWNNTYLSDNFKQRKKYEPLSKMLLKVADHKDCKHFPNNFNGLCAIEIRNFVNSHELNGRCPIFEVNTYNLIGFEVKRCFYNNNLEHYYTFLYNLTV